MKINLKYFCFCTLIGMTSYYINSCSEDFQLTEPSKDLPVVFGFLDRNDTAQYIRVEKLFVDENIPAIELAKRVDSVYYSNAIVSLVNITKKKEFILNKVDVSLEGFQRKEGPFAQTPNYMYKVLTKNIQLGSGDSIMLKIDRKNNLPLVTSRILMVKDFNFRTPEASIRELSFKPGFPQTFSWTNTPDAALYNFEIQINLDEKDANTNQTTKKTLIWPIFKNEFKNSTSVSNDEFYRILNINLAADKKYTRYITGISLIVKAGGNEIKSFNLLVNANLGITASQEIPRYSNLSEGIGIFSSTHTLIGSYGITAETRTSLDTSILTRDLNFE